MYPVWFVTDVSGCARVGRVGRVGRAGALAAAPSRDNEVRWVRCVGWVRSGGAASLAGASGDRTGAEGGGPGGGERSACGLGGRRPSEAGARHKREFGAGGGPRRPVKECRNGDGRRAGWRSDGRSWRSRPTA